MEYGDEGWGGVDGKRRPLRDQYRNAFFDTFGHDRLLNPFSVEFQPHQQLQVVMRLLEQAGVFHEGEDAALQLWRQAVATIGFGVVERPLKEGQLSFGGTRLVSLLDEFFVG